MAVKVENMISDLFLEVIVEGKKDVSISVSDINRPGLQLSGFYNYFANERVQIIGNAEWSFLDTLTPELRYKRVKKFFSYDLPCLIFARGLDTHEDVLEFAKLNNIWILRTEDNTTRFVNKLMNYLDKKLAPETRVHGVLVDIYGMGILITGESGIGKSEAALELIKRGHRLITDDAVDIKEIDGVLYGRSPYITEGMLEVRGMGIIDIPALYGLSSVLSEKNIDLIVYIEQWKDGRDYDRLGNDETTYEILNTPVRKMVLPIRPGRNIAVIIEAAAANYRYGLTSKETPVDKINKRLEGL
ncbi:HPr(Ser) kinase/phosphatase [Clostridium cellulovorans]|uniref:HPr kinase/phosphorylase n=1 Tax=Clostridium cellulovorans (strain ATCC 35296 / DSM 3052 / OCM 3 / 743B) TaxID=573061 RepID=D9SKB9_CLOC7|nr:HPr(Ser) kinase/phosphatase [Clostridium cellulovorans]ADL51415.1 HPr kinase [Clostridium cellulovorans 743B]